MLPSGEEGGLEIQLVELSHNNLARRSAGKFIR